MLTFRHIETEDELRGWHLHESQQWLVFWDKNKLYLWDASAWELVLKREFVRVHGAAFHPSSESVFALVLARYGKTNRLAFLRLNVPELLLEHEIVLPSYEGLERATVRERYTIVSLPQDSFVFRNSDAMVAFHMHGHHTPCDTKLLLNGRWLYKYDDRNGHITHIRDAEVSRYIPFFEKFTGVRAANNKVELTCGARAVQIDLPTMQTIYDGPKDGAPVLEEDRGAYFALWSRKYTKASLVWRHIRKHEAACLALKSPLFQKSFEAIIEGVLSFLP